MRPQQVRDDVEAANWAMAAGIGWTATRAAFQARLWQSETVVDLNITTYAGDVEERHVSATIGAREGVAELTTMMDQANLMMYELIRQEGCSRAGRSR